MNQEIRKMFCDLLGEDRVFTEELMSQHTTFKIGGPADYFLVPEKSEDVGAIVRLCKKEGIPYFILGNGSNLRWRRRLSWSSDSDLQKHVCRKD